MGDNWVVTCYESCRRRGGVPLVYSLVLDDSSQMFIVKFRDASLCVSSRELYETYQDFCDESSIFVIASCVGIVSRAAKCHLT